MDLFGRRILFVVPASGFDEAALWQTWQLLSEEGAWLTSAGDSPTGWAIGADGARERLAAPLSALRGCDFDAIVLIGCEGAPREEAERLVREAADSGAVIAAFGEGTRIPAAAQVEPTVTGRAGGLARFIAEIAVAVAHRPPARARGVDATPGL